MVVRLDFPVRSYVESQRRIGQERTDLFAADGAALQNAVQAKAEVAPKAKLSREGDESSDKVQ